jgi:hypothetical protein
MSSTSSPASAEDCRNDWRAGGGDAFLFCGVFAKLPQSFGVPAQRYRTVGLAAGIEILSL